MKRPLQNLKKVSNGLLRMGVYGYLMLSTPPTSALFAIAA